MHKSSPKDREVLLSYHYIYIVKPSSSLVWLPRKQDMRELFRLSELVIQSELYL